MPSKPLFWSNTRVSCETRPGTNNIAITGICLIIALNRDNNGFLQKPLQLLPIANGVDEPNGSLHD